MCGIAGFWQSEKSDYNDSQILTKMLEQIRHRGPDGTGRFLKSESGLCMGHTRLSIIDLETGEQPLFLDNKDLALTVNGEFYDYKRIRTELTLDGAHFKTKSDSEIALHLYKRHGLDFVRYLRGEFGFALYDNKEERLILVRDRFGVKPLYYAVLSDNVYYGSEAKAILAHPQVPARFSPEATLHQLMHTMISGTSAFKDVHAVKPGCFVVIERRNGRLDIQEKCYWDINFPEEDAREPVYDAQAYIESVQAELLEAVQHRLEADVPVGCYLSGGIDSCSMLGLASSVQQSPVKAYTISFDHSDYDESLIAVEMAKRTSADQEILFLTADDLYGENYLNTVWHAERTFYNTLGVAKYCMSRRVNESGYKVVVTGEGSDELFGGYPAFKRDVFQNTFRQSDGGRSSEYLRQMNESNKVFKGAILSEELVEHPAMEEKCGFTPSWIQPWIMTLELARPLLHDDLLYELRNYDPIAAIADSLAGDQIAGRHVLDIAQYSWIHTMLECQILNWGGDRVDMANAMESRPAFLDHHVAEAAKVIPPELRIRGNTEKWVLREAMKSILPEVLYKREKFAFMAPPGHTNEDKRKAVNLLIEEYLSESSVRRAGIFDARRMKAFLRGYFADKEAVSLVRKDAILNHILCLQVMHRQFIEGERF